MGIAVGGFQKGRKIHRMCSEHDQPFLYFNLTEFHNQLSVQREIVGSGCIAFPEFTASHRIGHVSGLGPERAPT